MSGVHDPFSLAQILGYMGMVMGIFAFLQKDDTRMKLIITGMAGILVAHFIMLGAYVAAVSAGLAGSRAGLSLMAFVKRHVHAFAAFYVIAALVLGFAVYTGPIDILPLIAAIIGTYAFFYAQGLKMRFALLIGTSVWIAHNALAGSYGPLLMEIFILIANLTTIIRMRRLKCSP